METLELKGGDLYLTKNPKNAWHILEGQVLVYILPREEDGVGRRFLLYEAGPGEWIPALVFADDTLGSWCFGLVALEYAKLRAEEKDDLDEIKVQFSKNAGILLFSVEDFEEQMIEQFNMNMIKEERFIYATALEQERTYEYGLQLIYRMFHKEDVFHAEKPSGNRLYDAVSKICSTLKIKIADYEIVKSSCKRLVTLEDISRLSHFAIRKIVLEEKWYKSDMGCFLAYRQQGHTPVACIMKRPGVYVAYDYSDNTRHHVDAAYAETLELQADMIYRPFPLEKMTLKKLISFGLQSVKKSVLVWLIILASFSTGVGLFLPYINQRLYDDYIPMTDRAGLVSICLVGLCCCIGGFGIAIVKNLVSFRSMSGMAYAIQNAVYDRLFHLPESFFRNYEAADLAQRVIGVSKIFTVVVDVILCNLLIALCSFVFLFRMMNYSMSLALTAAGMVFAAMIIIGFFGFWQMKYEKQLMEFDGKSSSVLYQFLLGISKIRIAGVENSVLLEYLKRYTKVREVSVKKERIELVGDTILGACSVIFSMVLYGLMINSNIDLSVGSFLGFITAFGAFSGAMLGLAADFKDVSGIIPLYSRCRPVLETLPEYDTETMLPGHLTGKIEASNLIFSYNAESKPVINKLSFQIKPGEYIGIVGASGCGKSTLLKLLLGFEKPGQGKIFYDGKDIDGLDKRELRKQFGVVLQEGALISGSIYDNIVITAPNTSIERVWQVIEQVGLKEDIEQMPMGIHTILSENSTTISGGQQQRILIARAIVGKPQILYFDEATSALDNVTQDMVCKSLDKLNTTRIVIAHRLSTVMNCDRIFVMDEGQIVEEGNYGQLMEQKGLFYQLAKRQMA